jgi:hypothetical protein
VTVLRLRGSKNDPLSFSVFIRGAIEMSNLHIVYNGEATDYAHEDLDIGVMSTDDEVLTALTVHAGIPRVKLNGFIVNRNMDSGDITVSARALLG